MPALSFKKDDMLRRKVVLAVEDGGPDENDLDLAHESRKTRRRIFTPWVHRISALLRKISVYGGAVSICCLVLVFLIVIFINEGHHITCRIHGALCTPFREYLNRFPMLPRRPKDPSTPNSPALPHSCERFKVFLSRHHSDPASHKRRLLFLIGESRGGSTYTYDTLNFHPDVQMIGQEALFSFSNNVCNNNQLLRNHQNCTFDQWLETLYKNAYDRIIVPSTPHGIVGTKINIEQIPPEFYHDLASYLACIQDSAIILHVTRASAIASFLNYQAEPIERIQDTNFDFDSNNLAKGLQRPLELDPQLAAEWVHTRDGLSQDLFRVLGFDSPIPLRYQRVYYEHLKDPVVGDDYWRSVFAFLGVDTSHAASKLRAQSPKNKSGNLRTHSKTHGNILCSHRIANWERVKEALGPASLSSIVCETHS